MQRDGLGKANGVKTHNLGSSEMNVLGSCNQGLIKVRFMAVLRSHPEEIPTLVTVTHHFLSMSGGGAEDQRGNVTKRSSSITGGLVDGPGA